MSRPILTLVGTFVYLGLAILGWGGFAPFFSHPVLIALVIATFVLTGAALLSRGNLSPGEREDRSNRWVIGAFALVGLLAAYLPAYTDRVGYWTVDGNTIRWLGVVLFGVGGALRWDGHSLFGRSSAVLIVPPLVARISAEERLLSSQFGDEYDAYRNRTWRLVPGLY